MFLTGEAASVAGVIATFVMQGGAGVRQLLAQAVRVRAPLHWWLYALLVPFIWWVAAGLLFLALHGKAIAFKPAAFMALGIPTFLVPFLFGPLGEEFGWRGFLLPRFVERFSVLPACLLVGVAWALWHWPLFYESMIRSPAKEIFFLVANVTGMSFLIGAVYLRTRSLLLSMLMHWSLDTAQALAGKLLPGLPDGVLNQVAFKWCETAVLALLVLLMIPQLLSLNRREPRDEGPRMLRAA